MLGASWLRMHLHQTMLDKKREHTFDDVGSQADGPAAVAPAGAPTSVGTLGGSSPGPVQPMGSSRPTPELMSLLLASGGVDMRQRVLNLVDKFRGVATRSADWRRDNLRRGDVRGECWGKLGLSTAAKESSQHKGPEQGQIP